jgi:hypothetical protein
MIGILILRSASWRRSAQATALKNTTDALPARPATSPTRSSARSGSTWRQAGRRGGDRYGPRTAWRTQVAATLLGIDIAANQRVPSIVVVAGPTFVGDTQPSSRVTVTLTWLQPGDTQQHQFQIVSHVSL